MAPKRTTTNINAAELRRWPLPVPDGDSDKDGRGRILIVAGSAETPGAACLCADAALRAGAGKLTVATVKGIASIVAASVPESRVIALPESRSGGLTAASVSRLGDAEFDAILMGPGLKDGPDTCAFVEALLARFPSASVTLDACAMFLLLKRGPHGEVARLKRPALLTPHAGEMAHLTGLNKQAIEANAQEHACAYAAHWNAVVALKGAATFVATIDGRTWKHEQENAGLAISGSGDVLAGIIAGLAARGAALEQAAAWGVYLHAKAGRQLAKKIGTLGYLARELAAEVPSIMNKLAD